VDRRRPQATLRSPTIGIEGVLLGLASRMVAFMRSARKSPGSACRCAVGAGSFPHGSCDMGGLLRGGTGGILRQRCAPLRTPFRPPQSNHARASSSVLVASWLGPLVCGTLLLPTSLHHRKALKLDCLPDQHPYNVHVAGLPDFVGRIGSLGATTLVCWLLHRGTLGRLRSHPARADVEPAHRDGQTGPDRHPNTGTPHP